MLPPLVLRLFDMFQSVSLLTKASLELLYYLLLGADGFT